MKLTWGGYEIDAPFWLEVMFVCAVIATAILWAGCERYAEADARARNQWNCPVSSLIEVRDPGMPWWTPDRGVTWLEVE